MKHALTAQCVKNQAWINHFVYKTHLTAPVWIKFVTGSINIYLTGSVNSVLSVIFHITIDPNVFKFQKSNHAWLMLVTGITKFSIQKDTAVTAQFALSQTLTRLSAKRWINLIIV